jgi:Family of unknown function (DUF5990)
MRLRVIVVSPLPGVVFAVQRGHAEQLGPTISRAEFVQFDLELRIGVALADGSPNYLGEFAQGKPADRFVYLNSGTLAGQHGSRWTRRAKLKLGAIPAEMARAVAGHAEHVVEAWVAGCMADGSPICASVKPAAVTWRLAPAVI